MNEWNSMNECEINEAITFSCKITINKNIKSFSFSFFESEWIRLEWSSLTAERVFVCLFFGFALPTLQGIPEWKSLLIQWNWAPQVTKLPLVFEENDLLCPPTGWPLYYWLESWFCMWNDCFGLGAVPEVTVGTKTFPKSCPFLCFCVFSFWVYISFSGCVIANEERCELWKKMKSINLRKKQWGWYV